MKTLPTRAYLTRSEAAEYLQGRGLKVASATLAKLAVNGGGPPFRKFMSRAVYEPDDLDVWAKTKLSVKQRSTATE